MKLNTETTWTQFWDMHSGGDLKEPPYHFIYIEAPEDEAKLIFQNRFGHNPNRVTRTCCGEDYATSSGKLTQITGYHRNCLNEDGRYKEEVNPERTWNGAYMTLEEYAQKGDVLFIPADEIKPEERVGELEEQGYVWVG